MSGVKLKTKVGVSLQGLQVEMRQVLKHAHQIWKEHGKELVVTSTTEGQHSPASYHYYGYAVDLRTRYFDTTEAWQVAGELRAALQDVSPYFDVVAKNTHIHVEYDFDREQEEHFKRFVV